MTEPCTCPCCCGSSGRPDDDGTPGWCDRCRMNIHSPRDLDTKREVLIMAALRYQASRLSSELSPHAHSDAELEYYEDMLMNAARQIIGLADRERASDEHA